MHYILNAPRNDWVPDNSSFEGGAGLTEWEAWRRMYGGGLGLVAFSAALTSLGKISKLILASPFKGRFSCLLLVTKVLLRNDLSEAPASISARLL